MPTSKFSVDRERQKLRGNRIGQDEPGAEISRGSGLTSVEIKIRDEQGNIVYQGKPKDLELGKQGLHEMEGGVEQWRHAVLSEIELNGQWQPTWFPSQAG